MTITLTKAQCNFLIRRIRSQNYYMCDFCNKVSIDPTVLSRQLRTGKFDANILMQYLKELKILPIEASYIDYYNIEFFSKLLSKKNATKLLECFNET